MATIIPMHEHGVAQIILGDRVGPTLERAAVAAALAGSHTFGLGDLKWSDAEAVTAMREVLGDGCFTGMVVIGEGEMDESPMLYIGERLGSGWLIDDKTMPGLREFFPSISIAVDPIEGTELCAQGLDGAISIIAASEEGGLLGAPDTYFMKMVVGEAARGRVDINAPIAENLAIVADSLDREIRDLVVGVLDRPRHTRLIQEIRQAGARVKLAGHGDVTLGIATALAESNIHMTVGVGGAPEGVITAAALKCLNGDIQCRLPNEDELTDVEQACIPHGLHDRMREMGIANPTALFSLNDLAPGQEMVVAAAGITQSPLFPKDARFFTGGNRVCVLSLACGAGIHRCKFDVQVRGGAGTVFRMP